MNNLGRNRAQVPLQAMRVVIVNNVEETTVHQDTCGIFALRLLEFTQGNDKSIPVFRAGIRKPQYHICLCVNVGIV